MSITSWLSMSSRLQRLPISLAKHTFSACQVLLAYLIISAVRMLVVHERRIHLGVERLGRLRVRLVVVADERQRRIAEIVDRGAFAQELGVHGDAEAGPVLLARRPLERRDHDLVRRAGQHGAADDDDVIAVLVSERLADLLADALRGTTGRGCRSCGSACRRRAATGRSSRTASAVLVVARSDPLAAPVANQLVEPLLDDRAAPFVEARDLVRVHVDADDRMTVGRKRRRRDAADIPEAKY